MPERKGWKVNLGAKDSGPGGVVVKPFGKLVFSDFAGGGGPRMA